MAAWATMVGDTSGLTARLRSRGVQVLDFGETAAAAAAAKAAAAKAAAAPAAAKANTPLQAIAGPSGYPGSAAASANAPLQAIAGPSGYPGGGGFQNGVGVGGSASVNASQGTSSSSSTNKSTQSSTNEAKNSTQMVPEMLGVYQQLLDANKTNYGNVLSAYQGQQASNNQQLPGIYQGYGDLNKGVANTLGMGQEGGWGVASPAAQAIQRQQTATSGDITQQMTSAGLGNTTAAAQAQQQAAYNTNLAYGNLGAQLADKYAGYQSQIGQAGLGAQMQGLGMQTGLTQSALPTLGQQYANTAGSLTGSFGSSSGSSSGNSDGSSKSESQESSAGASRGGGGNGGNGGDGNGYPTDNSYPSPGNKNDPFSPDNFNKGPNANVQGSSGSLPAIGKSGGTGGSGGGGDTGGSSGGPSGFSPSGAAAGVGGLLGALGGIGLGGGLGGVLGGLAGLLANQNDKYGLGADVKLDDAAKELYDRFGINGGVAKDVSPTPPKPGMLPVIGLYGKDNKKQIIGWRDGPTSSGITPQGDPTNPNQVGDYNANKGAYNI